MPLRCTGIIPACAGNTGEPFACASVHGDHPRVCGEHDCVVIEGTCSPGSSPRVRGTHDQCRRPDSGEGIIPACAGNTSLASGPSIEAGDHPRVCGEHQALLTYSLTRAGSSPRVRGTRRAHRGARSRIGIIPACAGNTCTRMTATPPAGDHPRVCGEHSRSSKNPPMPQGSSPRVRGTPPQVGNLRNVQGIIPACAGNTMRRKSARPMMSDHPRVCGEHNRRRSCFCPLSGSSPRVRGTLIEPEYLASLDGIIPACAGNTLHGVRFGLLYKDHPRVCGEHASLDVDGLSAVGSSPRVRGTPISDNGTVDDSGIIPACAGNTASCRA